MNALFLSCLIQNNYLLKKEKKLKFKYLDVRGEHSVLSESNKVGVLGSSSPCPGGVVIIGGDDGDKGEGEEEEEL
jgi:hypothetical protein